MMKWLLVVVFVFAGLVSLQAAEGRCLDEVLEATGKPSAIGELARANAFFTWKAVAKEKHGDDYSAWSSATERKLVCIDLMSGDHKGKWECTRSARPCRKAEKKEAAAGSCKQEAVKAYGRRQGSLKLAQAEAVNGWLLTVRQSFGDDWANWDNGQEKSLKCTKKTKWQIQCVAEAMPCKGT